MDLFAVVRKNDPMRCPHCYCQRNPWLKPPHDICCKCGDQRAERHYPLR